MNAYERVKHQLLLEPRSWLVTGAAGFIGSNLVEGLLRLDQKVTGLDNLSTGKQRNLDEVQESLQSAQWARFSFTEGNICDPAVCQASCRDVDFVLHQAALGSVPCSLENPILTNESNVTGFLNMLLAARDTKVRRFVYAASCSTYGDDPDLPKIEDKIGRPLSPYAVTKYVNELYADVFARCYGVESVGLRYFNIFGPRQDPGGSYSAVIPKWIAAMIQNQPIIVNGDGKTSRDFCYVEDVVQANLLAAATTNPDAVNQIYNIAAGCKTNLNELFTLLDKSLRPLYAHLEGYEPIYRDFRPGDIRDSQADIAKAARLLGYQPTHTVQTGLNAALNWYNKDLQTNYV